MIAAFIIFRGSMSTEVLVLDIVVSTIILALFFIDVLRPWDDEHTSRMGSMGVRWTMTLLYAFVAVAAMVVLSSYSFTIQLLVHGVLLALLLLAMALVLRTKEQIVSVHKEEKAKLASRDDVKRAWNTLLEKMNQVDTSAELRERTAAFVQNLRYLTPTNNPDAQETDRQLVEGAQSIGRMIGDFRMNADQAEQMLARCERLLQQRRTQYSN